ncbi:MAG: zinc-binding metallopeptidase family protein [Pseudohongiellaceae bacterium]
MKIFTCTCGQSLYFGNTRCLKCNSAVGFDPATFRMLPLQPGIAGTSGAMPDATLSATPGATLGTTPGATPAALFDATGTLQACRNAIDYGVCNWLLPTGSGNYCMSCNLNHTIPNLLESDRRTWWRSLEQAKRRLIYSLLVLGLPITGRDEEPNGLAFRFIEDKRTNPDVQEEHVNTGHLDGMITINIAEADGVVRERTRQYTGESYRTLLGHFRHESGHYYYSRLINNSDRQQTFEDLFGNSTADYAEALRYYYDNKFSMPLNPDLISHYAQSHPLEDWAEVWAHYLHMIDTLETAGNYGLAQGATHLDDIDDTLEKWGELTLLLNSLNLSMGLESAYPFVLSDLSFRKLRFVHYLIYLG